ncbi:MAG: PDZ domain-containing protein [Acidimicrobiales bacterium]
MRFDDDDDEEGFGPPPDPSVRAWRHPSEIASAEAAAARFAQDEERSSGWSAFSSPGAASTHPLAGLVLVTSALALAAVAAGALAVTSIGGGLSADAGSVAVANLEASESSIRLLNPDNLTSALPPLSDASTTTINSGVPLTAATSLRLPVSTTAPPGSVASTPTVVADTAVEQAVYVAVEGRRERVAAFTVDGTYAFAPAASVAGHDEVLMAYRGLFAPATVLDVDELTGVAVLVPDDPAAVELIARVAEAEPASTSMTGEVMDKGFTATASDDSLVYGALLTATGCPEGAGGAPLVDPSGKLLGMVIDSPNPLIAAVPLSDIRAFVTRIAQPDKATSAWLGVELERAGKQPLAVTAVAAASPAADAGLRPGDVIETFDGTRLQGPRHLEHLARHAAPGVTAVLTVMRDGKVQTVDVTVGTASLRAMAGAV